MSSKKERCPNCNALIDAVGVERMGGLRFCGTCKRRLPDPESPASQASAETVEDTTP